MKKIVLGIFALTLAFGSNAQSEKKQDKEVYKNEKKASKGKDGFAEMNLTDAQKQKLKSANEDFRNQMQDLKKNDNISVKDQREKREQLVAQHKQQLAGILTPEQLKQVESHEHFGKKGEGKGSRKFEDFGKDLNLSADQSAKIKTINESFRDKTQALHKNSSLSEDQKKAQMKSLSQQHKQEIETVLTNDQKQQLKDRLKNRPNRRAVK